METKLFIPDCHHPYQDKKAVAAVLRVIEEIQPSEVIILGDFLDMKAPARWSRALAEEFAAGLSKEAAQGTETLADLRRVYDGPVSFLLGNHEDRLSTYVKTKAPALAGIVPPVSELLHFTEFDVTEQGQPYPVAPGVVAIHGELLSGVNGAASAMKEVLRHGKSIIQGHSHRLGVAYKTTDKRRFGMECGWLGDIKRADYLKFNGVADWQQGFGLLHIDGSRVFPVVVPVFPGGVIVG